MGVPAEVTDPFDMADVLSGPIDPAEPAEKVDSRGSIDLLDIAELRSGLAVDARRPPGDIGVATDIADITEIRPGPAVSGDVVGERLELRTLAPFSRGGS